MEEEVFEMQNTQLELVEQLKESEAQNDENEEKIGELIKANEHLENNQAVYIAKKRDKVDEALAQYINEYPEREKLQIMFLRESEGVYQFGQKRVYIKVEKGGQIFVRVGGGFMGIDQFITQYTNGEVDKIDRRNVLERFQKKIAVQNISV